MKKTEELFEEVLSSFENADIRKYAEICLEIAPKYWYSVPASSTGKYHPYYALGDGGLVRHTIAVIKFLNYMFSIESVANQFTSRERDLLRVAGLAHDMWKSGTQEDYEKTKWTKFNHPIIAGKQIWEITDIPEEDRRLICRTISSHMGQWNTDKRYPDIILPKPEDKYQIILHLADYLASRKEIEIKFNKEKVVEGQSNQSYDIKTWRFPFGKHAGKTIPEIWEIDKGYILWAKKNMEKEPVKSLLQSFEALT